MWWVVVGFGGGMRRPPLQFLGEDYQIKLYMLYRMLCINVKQLSNPLLRRYENPPDSPPPQRNSQDDVTPTRVIRPSSSLVNIGRARNDDWSVSTSTRFYKFSPEGFNMARSAPIVHKPSLKIGIEGDRQFSVSNSEHFPAYNVR